MQFNRFVALASVSLISIATPAMAQEAAPVEESLASSDIIVEARRREENIQDIPLVVNAVTSETVDKLNIRNATEITAIVPGLSLTPNANGIGSSSSMRGINHDVNVSGENGTIQYYVNDVPVASNFVLQAMYDIGQITVERGPQGTLRGRSTPSGAININWRKPDLTEVGAFVSGSAGSASAKNVSNVTRLTQGNDNVFTASTTLINAATSRPFGSALYSSNYRGVAVTPPREVGVTFKVAFGSR